LTDLGLLPEGGWRKAGGTGITMNPGVDIKGVDQIKSGDIAGWFINTVAPAIESKFGSTMSTADLIQESSKMFGQQTGQRLALMFLANEAQRQRDVAIKNGVDPSGVVQGMYDKDYGANLNNLGAAISGFAQVLGSTEIPMAISGLHVLADAVHALTGGLAAVQATSPAMAKALVPFTPSMIGGAWDAVKDLWNHLPGMGAAAATLNPPSPPRTPYDNGGGPGSTFKGALPVVSVAPPQVSVAPTSVAVQVFVDSELVAQKVAESIARFGGFTSSSYDHDGRMGFAGPDVRN